MLEKKRPLKIFLCHSSLDSFLAHRLYLQLISEGAMVWFDEESLLLGQKWEEEIPKAIKESDIVIVCLSSDSVQSEGYIHTEIKLALGIADKKPDGKIFVVPIRFDDCIVPSDLNKYHWANFYENNGYVKLLKTLRVHADSISVSLEPKDQKIVEHGNDLPTASTFVEKRKANNELFKKMKNKRTGLNS